MMQVCEVDDPKVDRCYQLCKCHLCGCVRECMPSFDFYAKEEGGPLMCENCMVREVALLALIGRAGGAR